MSKAGNLVHEAVLSRTGGGGNFREFLGELAGALGSAREAQAEYKRQVARGVEPSDAVRSAFAKLDR